MGSVLELASIKDQTPIDLRYVQSRLSDLAGQDNAGSAKNGDTAPSASFELSKEGARLLELMKNGELKVDDSALGDIKDRKRVFFETDISKMDNVNYFTWMPESLSYVSTNRYNNAPELEDSIRYFYDAKYVTDIDTDKVMNDLETKYQEIQKRLAEQFEGGEYDDRIAELNDNYKAISIGIMERFGGPYRNAASGFIASANNVTALNGLTGKQNANNMSAGKEVISKNDLIKKKFDAYMRDFSPQTHDVGVLKSYLNSYLFGIKKLDELHQKNLRLSWR